MPINTSFNGTRAGTSFREETDCPPVCMAFFISAYGQAVDEHFIVSSIKLGNALRAAFSAEEAPDDFGASPAPLSHR